MQNRYTCTFLGASTVQLKTLRLLHLPPIKVVIFDPLSLWLWVCLFLVGVGGRWLEPIKKKYPDMSYGDLYTFAGVTAIEKMGGPQIK